MVKKIEERIVKLNNQKDFIAKTTAKFVNFSKTNAITPYNDSFEEYLKHLIENEKSLSKHSSKNEEVVNGLHQMLASYKEEKAILEN